MSDGRGWLESFSLGKKKGVAVTLNLLNCAVAVGAGTCCVYCGTVDPSLRLP